MQSLVMEINGLPLHVLVVHAAVVLTPIAALAAIGYAVVPKWRDWLRWPVIVAVVVAVGTVWVAYLSGDDFRGSDRFATATGEFAPAHEALVESHTIAGMKHGAPIRAGAGPGCCGVAGPATLDVGISSTHRILEFWGLAPRLNATATAASSFLP